MSSIFELKQRVPLANDPYDSLDKARSYDLVAARDQLLYPMERIVALLCPFCKKGMKLLNIGSETGILPLLFGGRFPDLSILGIEKNPFFVQVSKENANIAYLSGSPAKVEFVQSSFTSLPIEDNSMNIVFTNNLLYRCNEPLDTLQECVRVCTREGIILFYELIRDADEDKIRFVSQWIKDGKEEFLKTIKACYTVSEIKEMLKDLGLEHWTITLEQLSIRLLSNNIMPCNT